MDKQHNINCVSWRKVVIRLKLVSLQMDKQRIVPSLSISRCCDSLKISIFANG